jgi:xylulokinase
MTHAASDRRAWMASGGPCVSERPLVGLDVGTTGVKAVAVSRRIVATVLGVPLERTAGAEDGAAFGAALLAGVATGAFADAAEAAAACVHVTDGTEPAADWRAAYDEGYDRFRELYPTLRPLGEP